MIATFCLQENVSKQKKCVHAHYKAVSEAEKKSRREAVAYVSVQSFRRLREFP